MQTSQFINQSELVLNEISNTSLIGWKKGKLYRRRDWLMEVIALETTLAISFIVPELGSQVISQRSVENHVMLW